MSNGVGALYRHIILVVVILTLLSSTSLALKESVAVEEAKVFELIEIWEKTILPTPEIISPSGALAYSFREIETSLTVLTAYRHIAEFNDITSFQDKRDVEELTQLEEQQFMPAVATVMHKGYFFQNKKYPKFGVERTQISVTVGDVENIEEGASQVYTMLIIPRADNLITPQSIPGQVNAQIFPGTTQTVILLRGENYTAKFIVADAMTSQEAQDIPVVSYYAIPPPPEPVEEKESVTQQPAIILPQEEEKRPIITFLFSGVLIILIGGLGFWYYKKRQMRELMVKYGGPQAHVEVTEQEKKHAKINDHLHDILRRVRRHSKKKAS